MTPLDRDLLILEPRLFNELAWLGQRLHRSASATMQGGGVGVTDASAPFSGLGIAIGHVILLNDVPVEITAITSATQATISLIRASTSDTAIPARNLTGTVTIECFTFAPQIAAIHERIIRGLGLATGVTSASGPLAEDRITNPRDVAHTVVLGALHQIYSAAAPLIADATAVRAKADTYRERFALARRSLAAELDSDGDGIADAVRRISVINLVRG